MTSSVQKEIAELIKQMNWLRQNPKITPEQLNQLKTALEQAVQALGS
jgi:hypothetical protein